MSFESAILSETAKAAVFENIGKKLSNCKCVACDVPSWQITEMVFEIRQYLGAGFNAGGALIPVIIVTCTSCGQVLTFNAIYVGAINPDGTVK